jgi:mRNA-degrading endonuclease RelE of RelBE toxin-antitoxin system
MGWLKEIRAKRELAERRKRFTPILELVVLSTRESQEVSLQEAESIIGSLKDFGDTGWLAKTFETSKYELKRIWGWEEAPVQRPPAAFRKSDENVRYQQESNIRSGSADRNWLLAMTHDFIKEIQSIDRKLQGRILEAIGDICQNPVTIRGDTVKPLSHEMKGLWRYRLGDYRLIYQPVPATRQIILIRFDSRGGVYG